MEDDKFSEQDLELVQGHWNKTRTKLSMAVMGIFATASLTLLLPAQWFRSGRRAGMDGNMLSQYGITGLLIVLLIGGILVVVAYKILKLPEIKRDLKEQIKSPVRVKVRWVKPIKEEIKKELRKVGDHSTHEIIFHHTTSGVKNYLFNKEENPELAKAKEIYMEVSKYSRVELSKKILDSVN